MNISEKIKEAEMYYSMGMLDESLSVYEALLSVDAAKSSEHGETISLKTQQLKKEISDSNNSTSQKFSNEAISLIRQTVSAQGTDDACGAADLLDSAAAFEEFGLMEEAVVEYEKLLNLDRDCFDYPPVDVILKLLKCMGEIADPEDVVKRTKEHIGKQKLTKEETAELKHRLKEESEKNDWGYLDKELFQSTMEGGPQKRASKDNTDLSLSANPSASKYSYLLGNKIITTEQLKNAMGISKKSRISIEKILVDNYKVDKAEVGKSLSEYFNCPFLSYDPEVPVPVELIGRLKKAFLIHYAWVPLSWNTDGVEVLVDDPNDLRKTDHIKALMATDKILFSVGIKEDIVKFIENFYSPKADASYESSMDDLDSILPDVTFEEEEDPDDDVETINESSSQVMKFVDQILITAFRKNVSDIHIEPSPITKTTSIRFRMDGVCHQYIQAPNIMAPGILSRLKIMSNLDIAEKRLPQDGKIKVKRKGIPPFELRLSTMPTAGGHEDAVLRMLAKAGAMKLEQMGLNDRNLDVLKKIIVQPYGLILVVGPTGSGKTTTLHSALDHINKPEIKIWTAEDPVEISQPGLRQVEAKPAIGLDFARIMRGFLRLDPDVIMIGEMRDKETASIGVEASLTGHLVFSTLHTNSAPETITRLLDMGINALNFSDALLGVLAQRLVRRLCTDCKEGYKPTPEMFDDIVSYYGSQQFKNTGIEYDPELTLYRSAGCDKCSDSGYKGRMGIHELMEGTKAVKRLIKKQAPTEKLFVQALEDSMTTLKQDGIEKVFQGITEVKEIRRVCIE